MNMVHHFFGHRFELRQAADAFRTKHGDRYDVVTTLDPAHVETPDLDKAYAVAEFMLNLLDIRMRAHSARRRSVRQSQLRHTQRRLPYSGTSRFSPDPPSSKNRRGLKSRTRDCARYIWCQPGAKTP